MDSHRPHGLIPLECCRFRNRVGSWHPTGTCPLPPTFRVSDSEVALGPRVGVVCLPYISYPGSTLHPVGPEHQAGPKSDSCMESQTAPCVPSWPPTKHEAHCPESQHWSLTCPPLSPNCCTGHNLPGLRSQRGWRLVRSLTAPSNPFYERAPQASRNRFP